jgi:drug/metabolite transporter (DMT)-like permease
MSLTTILSLLYGFYTRVPYFPLGPPQVRRLLVMRGVGGLFGVTGLYWSLAYLPLAEATVLTFLAPILTCYACSLLIEGETFSRQQQLAAFASLAGVVLIARPYAPILTGDWRSPTISFPIKHTTPVSERTTISTSDSPTTVTSKQHLLAVLLALVGVVGATTAMTSIRRIGIRAHPLISVNYFSTLCTLVSFVAVFANPSVGFRLPGNPEEWVLLLLLGVFGYCMQFLLTAGLSHGGPGSSHQGQQKQQQQCSTLFEQDPESGRSSPTSVTNALKPLNSREPNSANPQAPHTRTPASTPGTRATSMLYTQMLFALVFDKAIWDITPGWSSWLGSAIILTCAAWVGAARGGGKEVEKPVEEERDEDEDGMAQREDGYDDRIEVERRPRLRG